MADFTAVHAKQIADDAIIRNLLDRRAVYNALLDRGLVDDSALLSVIQGKYANVTNDVQLRAIVDMARSQDKQEIEDRIVEIIPPV